MRLCAYRLKKEGRGTARIGIATNEGVTPLAKCEGMIDAFGMGLGQIGRSSRGAAPHAWKDVSLSAPVPRPGKILATIVNTQGMLGGGDVELAWPRIDMKAPSTVVGPGDRIVAPRAGVRPEVELAAIIGRRAGLASKAEASEAIFGYTVLNDVTAPKDSKEDAYDAYRKDPATGQIRKARMRGPLFRSKNHDTFCPMGPWIVTRDELSDTGNLRMTTKFRGKLVQDGSTADYLFTPEEIVAYVSRFLTLEPGDVVSCGSVGWSESALGRWDPTEFVLPVEDGELKLEIEGVGTLRNPLVYK